MNARAQGIAALVALIGLSPLAAATGQTRFDGILEPVEFTDATGDVFYFKGVMGLSKWGGRWLFLVDSFTNHLYMADTESETIRQVGAYGGGPGEYRWVGGVSTRGDTLIVGHDGTIASEYSLPTCEFLERRNATYGPFPRTQEWESPERFLSTDLPESHRFDGLIGRFSREGELLKVFGDYDQAEEYGGDRLMKIYWNGGTVLESPGGSIAFVYYAKPVLLLFSYEGALERSVDLQSPWADDVNGANIISTNKTDSGFMVTWKGRGNKDGSVPNAVATYTWGGSLVSSIYLADVPVADFPDGMVIDAIQLGDHIWIARLDDPPVGRLRLIPRKPD